MASLAAVALVAMVAISTSHPSKALAPEEKSSHSLTKETIEPESDISNTYNNKPQVSLNIAGGNVLLDPIQGRAALTVAWRALLAGLGRENDHCLEPGNGLQPVPNYGPHLVRVGQVPDDVSQALQPT